MELKIFNGQSKIVNLLGLEYLSLVTEEYKARIQKLVDNGHITKIEALKLLNDSNSLY
ncbi:hypothetical protein [Vibrio cholerae]|uniref:hypothetical protein n=1 Tax=Vibrio cholerae TaxID=666 RepID=UPI00163D1F5F|nr:hypothetical protein [Vibrio cholerae]ELJ8516667.1 hypothetical protein [Vibrio cholerae]